MKRKITKVTCKRCNKIFYYKKGTRTRKFCSHKCYLIWQKGENSSWFGRKHTQETKDKMSKARLGNYLGEKSGRWKGGIYTDSYGYIHILSPSHPNKDIRGYVKEHRLEMEKHLKRYLTKKEIVHHEDHVKNNNNIDNLKLFKNCSEHVKYHKNELMDLRTILEDKNG